MLGLFSNDLESAAEAAYSLTPLASDTLDTLEELVIEQETYTNVKRDLH